MEQMEEVMIHELNDLIRLAQSHDPKALAELICVAFSNCRFRARRAKQELHAMGIKVTPAEPLSQTATAEHAG